VQRTGRGEPPWFNVLFAATILPWKCSPVFSFFPLGVDFSLTPDFCPLKPYFSFYYGVKSFFVFLPTLVRPGFPNIAKSSKREQATYCIFFLQKIACSFFITLFIRLYF